MYVINQVFVSFEHIVGEHTVNTTMNYAKPQHRDMIMMMKMSNHNEAI